MNEAIHILTLLMALGCGLMAGLFFVFSNTVMGALAKMPPPEGMAAMQWINRVIQNPLFLVVFMGTGFGCSALVGDSIWRWERQGALLRLLGASLYMVGGFMVTVAANVPMNERLDKADATAPGSAALWADYLVRWTRWNHVRTVACLAAAAMLTLGLCEGEAA